MKAVGLHRYLPISDEDSLLDVEVAKPTPNGHDILVQVKAISVNPVDTKVRKPKDTVEQEPKILGWDVAGIVEQVGPGVTLFKSGDEVYYAGSITRAGGNSEYHLVDERIVGKKPASLDFAQAAALPLTAITAWESLYDRLGISGHQDLNQQKTILMIGAAGGVGSIATQFAHLAGLTVIGTASRPESVEWVKQQGAAHVINHFEPFMPQLRLLGFESVDYILCLSHTDLHWANMVDAIAPQGKICSIVDSPVPLDLSQLKNKSATFVWEFMFTRPMYNTLDMIEQHKLLNAVADLVDAGKVKTTVTERLTPINASNLRLAHAKLEIGRTIGKIVLEHFE
ncbi:zinc-binding alcohol dehydrogenase family protein [Paenibacillus sp. 481]|uniref:zinc-binding alcohol dehydrogenase family protein n=1 Tax=Paenibacillus sp. 481 TaxID=2835869 RepID=UPI001E53E38F|nr:zinc-binding alcohol dehydrogenase family protein [Paenibacillus sp. 481]